MTTFIDGGHVYEERSTFAEFARRLPTGYSLDQGFGGDCVSAAEHGRDAFRDSHESHERAENALSNARTAIADGELDGEWGARTYLASVPGDLRDAAVFRREARAALQRTIDIARLALASLDALEADSVKVRSDAENLSREIGGAS